MAEELAAERGGKKPAGSEKHMMWGEVLEFTFYVKSRRGICFLLNLLSYDGERYLHFLTSYCYSCI